MLLLWCVTPVLFDVALHAILARRSQIARPAVLYDMRSVLHVATHYTRRGTAFSLQPSRVYTRAAIRKTVAACVYTTARAAM